MSWTQLLFFTSKTHKLHDNFYSCNNFTSACKNERLTLDNLKFSMGVLHCGIIVLAKANKGSLYCFYISKYSGNNVYPNQIYEIFSHRIQFMRQITAFPYLLACLGDDNMKATSNGSSVTNKESSIKNILRVIHIDKEVFKLIFTLPLHDYTTGQTIKLFSVSSSGQQVSLGLEDGSVVIVTIRNFDSERTADFITMGRQIMPPQPYAVSSLIFCDVPVISPQQEREIGTGTSTKSNETRLFVTLDSNVSSTAKKQSAFDVEQMTIAVYSTEPSLLNQRKDISYTVLDEYLAVARNCCCLDTSSCELLVAQNDALYLFSIEERGSAIGIEGVKHWINCCGNYVLVITEKEFANDAEVSGSSDDMTVQYSVIIYDLKCRYICFRLIVDNHIEEVLNSPTPEGQSICLITSSGEIIIITEVTTDRKIDSFVGISHYDQCVKYLADRACHPQIICAVFNLHADYLYFKQDFEGAVQNYIYAIGSAESYTNASLVIERFLDRKQRHLLARYLVARCLQVLTSKSQLDLLFKCCREYLDRKDLHALVNIFLSKKDYFKQLLNVKILIELLIDQGEKSAALAISQHY